MRGFLAAERGKYEEGNLQRKKERSMREEVWGGRKDEE